MDTIFQNIILGISIAAPIGPASVAIMKNGIKSGFIAALKTAIGVILADTTYILVVYFGVSGFVTIPIVKTFIFICGTVVLFYLGYQTIRGARAEKEKIEGSKIYKNLIVQGYLVNISNPVAVVWWLGIFGSTLAATAQDANKVLTLIYSLFIVAGILVWHIFLSFVSAYGAKLLSKKVQEIIAIISGVVLILYGLRFAYNAIISIVG